MHSGSDDEAARVARRRLAEALGRVGTHDPAALRQVYDLTSAKLFGICLRICKDQQVAEDILQTVYLKVWDRAARFDAERGSPISWLAVIARNTAIDWRRSTPSVSSVPVDEAYALADESPAADVLIERDEAALRVARCLEQLEGKQRLAIRSAFFDGLTYSELASREAVPLGTMKSWIRRGLLKLKACLADG